MEGLKDVLLQIRYKGDIGYAFINGEMVHDNFWNGDLWEIGLRTLAEKLKKDPLTISITPLKEGANVNVESAMAARMENVKAYTGELESVELKPVYEFSFRGSNAMYDANTLKILFRFSQIPLTVYTREWIRIESFASFSKAPETFEKRMLEKVQDGLAGKSFLSFL